MHNRIAAFLLSTAVLALPALAQNAGLPASPPVEKALAARAANVTEVTLGKSMLSFASGFLNGKDSDEARTRRLIAGLDGIYVREYEFDKEGQYSSDEIDQLRKYFETSEWSPLVRERERNTGETTDVMVKLVNGESQGMFILTAEPKELTIVLILGPIRMDELGELRDIGGLGALRDVARDANGVDKDKIREKHKERAAERAQDKAHEKAREKDKSGDDR
jgi:Sec-independent protein translocase protein TatA